MTIKLKTFYLTWQIQKAVSAQSETHKIKQTAFAEIERTRAPL